MTFPLICSRDTRPETKQPSVVGPGGVGQASFQIGAAPPIAVLLACSSSPPKPEKEDRAPEHPTVHDAPAADTAPVAGQGDVQVRVEWHDVPVVARASPGRTRCGTARAAAVAPTTMWGIPEVVVLVDGASMPLGEVKVTASECAITPRAVVGDRLTITSSAPGPLKLNLAAYGPEPESIDGIPAGIPVLMPIAGHQVTRTLESGLHLLGGTGTGDPIWIVAKPNAVVTDANGQAVFKDLAAGSHVVTAWLPARGGQKPRLVTAKASVTAGTPGELSIDLGQ